MENTNEKEVRLSEHFTLREMIQSGTALRLNIDNTPDAYAVECLRLLCRQVLEPLRRRFGVIRVTSGYRCLALNRAVGGAARSQHMRGQAADLHVSSPENERKMFDYIRQNLVFDQLLLEHSKARRTWWIHVSYHPVTAKNRLTSSTIEV